LAADCLYIETGDGRTVEETKDLVNQVERLFEEVCRTIAVPVR
jgi:hypothetical protein